MFFLVTQSTMCHWIYFCRVNMNGTEPQPMVTDDYGNLRYCGKNLRASLT